MKIFIPKEKLSKKEKKRLAAENRQTWETDPRTRVVESKKVYRRGRDARNREDDYGPGVFSLGTDRMRDLKKALECCKIICF